MLEKTQVLLMLPTGTLGGLVEGSQKSVNCICAVVSVQEYWTLLLCFIVTCSFRDIYVRQLVRKKAKSETTDGAGRSPLTTPLSSGSSTGETQFSTPRVETEKGKCNERMDGWKDVDRQIRLVY